MPGTVYRVIPKQQIAYSTAATSSTPLFIAKGIDISQYREATLLVRVHAGTNLASATLVVAVYTDAPTSEDNTEFYGASTWTTLALAATSPPFTQTVTVGSANLPAFLRIGLYWSAGAAANEAMLSADLIAKS